MVRFSQQFTDPGLVASLAQQVSWTHFRELLPLATDDARAFYVIERRLGVRDLRRAIDRKAFERREIADSQIPEGSAVPLDAFCDPVLLDMLGLADTFLERDLEAALRHDMESFLLELGRGWAFVERQKRITFDGDDYYLDLLFYSRPLRRLIAVELKVGKFKPSYQGQMNFYLKWLDRHERQADENPPIGLILCTEASRDQIELLEMHKDGIVVAEYWTALPPKAELEVMTRAYKTPNWPAAWAKEDAQHRGGPLRTMTKHDVQVQLRAITEQSRLFRDVLSRARHGFASELRMAVWRNRMMSTFNYHSACELVVHWIKRLSPAIAFSPTVCRDEPRTDRRGQSR